MKHLIIYTFIFLLVFVSMGRAQMSLYLIVEDNIGRRDTVTFGYMASATLGVDSLLGEENMYLNDFDSLEIRSIQRDTLNHNCLRVFEHLNEPIYFEENLDLKIDYRPALFGDTGALSSPFYNFEFIVKGVEYPITVYGNFEDAGYFYCSPIALFDSSCNKLDLKILDYYMDPFFVLNDSSQNVIIINLAPCVGIKSCEKEPALWNLFPNPGNEKILIEEIPYRKSLLQIYNMSGALLYSKELSGNQFSLDIDFLPPGNYIINLTDIENRTYSGKIFIKSGMKH